MRRALRCDPEVEARALFGRELRCELKRSGGGGESLGKIAQIREARDVE